MTTGAMSDTEVQHRSMLADVKHRHFLAKRQHQVERMKIRVGLLVLRAKDLSEETKADLAAKHSAFKREVDALVNTAGVTAKEHRAAATAAWQDLRTSFNAAYEKAGLGKARQESKAPKTQ